MKSKLFRIVCAVAVLSAGLAIVADEPVPQEKLRAELDTFFQQAAEMSPSTFGALGTDPETLAAIRGRVAKLSADELSELDAALAEVPDWKIVPEALSASLPQEALQQINASAKEIAARAERLEQLRGNLAGAYGMLQMMPEAKLAEAGLDREALARIQENLSKMPAPGLALAEQQLGLVGDDAFAGVPPAVRAHVRELATHGPLLDADRIELDRFRGEMQGFFDDVRALPAERIAGVDVARLAGIEARMAGATPEMLYVLRRQLDTPQLRRAMADVRKLAAADSLGADDRAALETFRAEIGATFAAAAAATGNAGLAGWSQRIAQLDTAELLLLQGRIDAVPSWRTTLPAVLGAAARERNAQAETLEPFREAMVAYYDGLRGQPGVATDRAERAALWVRSATLDDLDLMHDAYGATPEDSTPAELAALPLAIDALGGAPGVAPLIDIDCRVSLGSITIPIIDETVSLGTLDFNFICNPIESVINFLEDVIDAIEDVVVDTFNAIVNLPNTIKDFFVGLAQSALSIFSPENLQNALGLNGDFWNNLPQVPQIPCPPDGFNIPFFGPVGEEETASKYSRYLWIFEKVLEIIPDTEISLAIQIPAQTLFAGVQYLGICLDAAADERAEQETTMFREATGDEIANTRGDIADTRADIAALSGQLGNVTAALQSQLAAAATEFVRLQIEANLLEPDGSSVSTFQLPQSQGGHLEFVRDIVAEAIDAAAAQGQTTGNARINLSSGESRLANGQYKLAYFFFRRAYQLVVPR